MTNSADPDQKPTDLDLHCWLRQGMSCLAREGLIFHSFLIQELKIVGSETVIQRICLINSCGLFLRDFVT